MQDKVFIDSNVFIYAFLEDSIYDEKRDKTISLIINPFNNKV
jgi:predicted nucleic acid-binding protein